jgi:hypothetical protein
MTWILFVAFAIGAGAVSSPVQVGPTHYASFEKCKAAADASKFAGETNVIAVLWCGATNGTQKKQVGPKPPPT